MRRNLPGGIMLMVQPSRLTWVGNEEEAPVSEVEENKGLVRRYYEEVWSKGNVAAVDEFMAADYVPHSIPSVLMLTSSVMLLPQLRGAFACARSPRRDQA